MNLKKQNQFFVLGLVITGAFLFLTSGEVLAKDVNIGQAGDSVRILSDDFCLGGVCRTSWLWNLNEASAYYNNGRIGIGTSTPGAALHVNNTEGFYTLGSVTFGGPLYKDRGATSILTVDNSGNVYATSTASITSAVGLPTSATNGQTLRYNNGSWAANSTLYNNGTNVGVGMTSPSVKLDVAGQGRFQSTVFPVVDIIRDTTSVGASIYGGAKLERLTSVPTNNGGIGFYFKYPDSTGVSTFAGMFGGALSNITNGSEVGDIVFGSSWQGADPASNQHLIIRATGATTANVLVPNGNVGIGIINPGNKLDVRADDNTYGLRIVSNMSANNTYNGIKFGYDQGTLSNDYYIGKIEAWKRSGGGGDLILNAASNALTYNSNQLVLAKTGNVGIGTTTPSQKLHVNGSAQLDAISFGVTPGQSQSLALTTVEFVNAKVDNLLPGGASSTWAMAGNNIYNVNSGNVGIGTTAPGVKFDVAGGAIRTNNQLISTIANGTAPIVVTSATLNTNLNADLLDGQHGSYYANASSIAGTQNYVPIFSSSTAITNSSIYFNESNLVLKDAQSVKGLMVTSGLRNEFLFAHAKYVVNATLGGSPVSIASMFDGNTSTTYAPSLASLPLVIEITGFGSFHPTYHSMFLLGWRDAVKSTSSNNGATLTDYVIEKRLVSSGSWETVATYSGVSHTLPMSWGMSGGTNDYFDGIRITITGLQGSTWSSSLVYLTELGMRYTGGATAWQGVGALGLSGGSIYGNFSVMNNASVGIGTTAPSQKLHVNGSAQLDAISFGVTPGQSQSLALTTVEFVNAKVNNLLPGGASSTWAMAGNNIYNVNSGNVGIGTTNPTNKLVLDGVITAEAANVWAGPSLELRSNNSSTYWGGAKIQVGMNDALGSGNRRGTLRFLTMSDDSPETYLERMRINEVGNVGIGTTNPTAIFQTQAPTNWYGSPAKPVWAFSYSNQIIANHYFGGTWQYIIDNPVVSSNPINGGGIHFQTLDITRLSIQQNGNISITSNVGIGTSTPGAALHVNNTEGFYTLGSVTFGGPLYKDRGAASILTVDNSGNVYATSTASITSAVGLPTSATNGQTLRYNNGSWINNSVLYNNGTNVGIGTTTPTVKLEVVGEGKFLEMLTLTGQGNSGSNSYGMVSDTALNIQHPSGGSSSIYFKSGVNTPSDFGYIRFEDSYTGSGENARLSIGVENDQGTNDYLLLKSRTVINSDGYNSDHANIMEWLAAGVEKARLTSAGNLGIGTTTPGQKLSIGGSATYAIDAGNQRIGNVAEPTVTKDVVTLGFLNSSLSAFAPGGASSTWALSGNNIYNTNQTGNVGIGTTGPNDNLTIHSSSAWAGIGIKGGTGGSYIDFYKQNGTKLGGFTMDEATGGLTLRSYAGTNAPVIFQTNSVERVRVDSTGNVGVGITNPAYKLDVRGSAYIEGLLTVMAGESFTDKGMIGILYDRNELTNAAYRGTSTISIANGGTFTDTAANKNRLVDASGNYINIDNLTAASVVELKFELPSLVSNYGRGLWMPFFHTRARPGDTTATFPTNITAEVSNDGVTWYKPSSGAWDNANFISNNLRGFWMGGEATPNSPAALPGWQWKFARFTLSNFVVGTNYGLWISEVGMRHVSASAARQFVSATGDNVYGNLNILNGNVGIGTTNPTQKLHVNGGAQLGLVSYGMTPGTTQLSALTTVEFVNAKVGGSGGVGAGTSGQTLHHNGTGWVANSTVFNNGTNVGIGTTVPGNKLDVNGNFGVNGILKGYGSANGNFFEGKIGVNSLSAGSASLAVFGNAAIGTSYLSSPAPTNGLIVQGNVGIGTSSPAEALHVVGNSRFNGGMTLSGNLNMSASTLIVNKITANTIDPLYTVDGVKYSTFASAIVGGVKEEYVGRIKASDFIKKGNDYEAVLDMEQIEEGSDLWVWYKVIDFNVDNVEIFLTPKGERASMYADIEAKKIIVRSDKATEAYIRLIGKRFDWHQWPTRADDQNQIGGLFVD